MVEACRGNGGMLTGTLMLSEALGGKKTVNLISHPHCSLSCEKRRLNPPYILLLLTSTGAAVDAILALLENTRCEGRGVARIKRSDTPPRRNET